MNQYTKTAAMLASRVAASYGTLPQVEAVVLAGSQATQLAEPGSDIDLYVYWNAEIPLTARRAIAEAAAKRVEVNNQFWEPGDEWIDKPTGIHVDVMFRHTRWIEDQLKRVLKHHEASVGYSTCFWHSVVKSRLLFDKTSWFAALQSQAGQPYPEELRTRIIVKNYPILRDTISSYQYQLRIALRRGDKVSLIHRIAAFLASYFDIIFAVNRLPHPGEKRILRIAEVECAKLPKGMRAQINELLTAVSGEGQVIEHTDALIDGLDGLLQEQGVVKTPGKCGIKNKDRL